MSVNLSPVGGVAAQFFDNNGVPLSGGLIYTYAAGTSTPQATYTSSSGNVAQANPIVLDSAGRVPGGEIWITENVNYKFALNTSANVLIGTYDNISGINSGLVTFEAALAASSGSSLVGFIQYGTGAMATTVQTKLRESVSVKDFGALGDGSGATPTSTGQDISTATWNTWDNTPWKDNPSYSPYYANSQGTFQPPRAKPFANDDTWDYIGCNLALWQGARQSQKTYFPAGTYVMNAYSTTAKGAYQGLALMRGMEQTICGAGPFESNIVWKENAAFFTANNFGTVNYYKLLTLYRVGGPPTNVTEMGFVGPSNYDPTALNMTCIDCENINGITFRNLWLTSVYRGFSATTSSGDSYIRSCTAEYCFGSVIYTDATSDFKIDFCNFTASATITNQTGVLALGSSTVTNTNFVGMNGPSFTAATGIFSNNTVVVVSATANVIFTDTAVISGNNFQGSSASFILQAVKNASIVGNTFNNSGNHASINIGNGANSSATNIVIDGNTFIKTNAASEAQNYTIIANENNVGYIGAATNTVIISNNTFQGRTLTSIGSATMMNNTFDTSIVPGNVNSVGDVSGLLVTSGTGGASFTFNVTGLIGQSQGGTRDIRRVTIINVYSNATGHEVHGVAIYTNNYLGYAVLLGTLGKFETNGTITFGASTVYPTVTITNTSGNTTGYQVYALPMI